MAYRLRLPQLNEHMFYEIPRNIPPPPSDR